MKTPVRRRVASAALLLLLPAATACGFNEQTDQVYQPATGVIDRSGEVDILNALVVSGTNGSGVLAASLVNKNQTQPVTLLGVTGPQIQGSSTRVRIPADGVVDLAAKGNVAISGPTVVPGKFVRLTLNFSNGQTTTVNVPVEPRTGDYAAVPMPAPSASATPSGSSSPSSAASPSASASPSS